MSAGEKNGRPGLGVLTGFKQIARAWGPDATARQMAHLASKGTIRVHKEPGGRLVHTTIDHLREDRDRIMGGNGG